MSYPFSTVFASAARTVTANSNDQQLPRGAKGLLLVLDVTAASGTTPTLDVKIQVKDPIGGGYVDVAGAAFAQKSATGTSMLTIAPGIAETANVSINDALAGTWRAVATIGGVTPSFTFSLSAEYV